jgi:hypothetical protein
MKANYKRPALVMLMICVLTLPYLGFAMYYGSQFRSAPAPVWFTDTLLIWFTVNFCIAMFAIKRILRGQVVDAEKAREADGQAVGLATKLVAIWSVFLLFRVKQTVQGKLPLNRAIPAGIFLLFYPSTHFSVGEPIAPSAATSSESGSTRELP